MIENNAEEANKNASYEILRKIITVENWTQIGRFKFILFLKLVTKKPGLHR